METITNTQAIFSLLLGILSVSAMTLPVLFAIEKAKRQMEADRGIDVGCPVCRFTIFFLLIQFVSGMVVYFFTQLISIPIKSHNLSVANMYELFWHSKQAAVLAANGIAQGALYLSYIVSEAFRLTNAFLPLLLIFLAWGIVKVHLTSNLQDGSRFGDYFFAVVLSLAVVSTTYIGWSEIGGIVLQHPDSLKPHEQMWRFWRIAAGLYNETPATATPTLQNLHLYELPQR